MKHHTLIVGHDFSIANDTDADVYTDYFPGLWAIGSQSAALKYAREILAQGDRLTVSDYNQPRYHALANKFIQALGLKQELFPEPKPLAKTSVTNGKPANLAQLQRYLVVGRKIKAVNYGRDGGITHQRETFVTGTQSNAVILDRAGKKSWMAYGKADGWRFDNDGATCYDLGEGGYVPYWRLEYLE